MSVVTKEELIETVKTRETWNLLSRVDCPYAAALQMRQCTDIMVGWFIATATWADGTSLYRVSMTLPSWYQETVTIALHESNYKTMPSPDLIALLQTPDAERRQKAYRLLLQETVCVRRPERLGFKASCPVLLLNLPLKTQE